MNAMLSEALQDFTGLLKQLLTNLLGNNADVWGIELKRFLRKEPCWTNDGMKSVVPPESMREPKPLPIPLAILVNCNANPKIGLGFHLTPKPYGTEHRQMGTIILEKRDDGKLYANSGKVVRHCEPEQNNVRSIKGYELREKLKDIQVLNACIADALLANPELIPDEWKSGYTYFWGTILGDEVSSWGYCNLYVMYIYWSGGQWYGFYRWLGNDWRGLDFTASLAS